MATSGDQELVAKDELATVGGLDKAEALLAYVEATPDRDSAARILREDPIIGGIGGKRLSKATGVDVARAAKGAMASREDVNADRCFIARRKIVRGDDALQFFQIQTRNPLRTRRPSP